MNKNLIAIAVGASFVIPSAAFADTKVYGKFNVGLESQKDEIGLDKSYTDNTWVFKDQNNSSRLGFKGDQEVGIGDLKVIYQLEYGVDPDGSEGSAFSERNIFVGLAGGFGTVQFGKMDTPLKNAGAAADQFNDESIGDDNSLMVGETRSNNMFQYASPKIADSIKLTAAIMPGESRTALDDANDVDKGLADTYYVSAEYDSKVLYASIAYAGHEAGNLKFDGKSDTLTKTIGYDVLRLAAVVKPVAGLEISGLYQQASGIDQDNGATEGGDAKEDTFLAGIGYSFDAFKVKAQYGQTKGDITDLKRTSTGVGVDYKLSKSAMAQLYYVGYKQDADAGSDPKSTVTGVGFVFSF